MADNFLNLSGLTRFKSKIDELLNGKQDTLVSGTNIKTINNTSLLGNGNIDVEGGGGDIFIAIPNETTYSELQAAFQNGKAVYIQTNQQARAPVSVFNYNTVSITMIAVAPVGDLCLQRFVVSNNNIWTEGVPVSINDLQSQIGTLTNLTTDDKTSLVNAINEVYEKSGEPFRVKNWTASWSAGVNIEPCTTDKTNTALAKMVFSIDNVEGADYQIVGMIAYEVFDNTSGGNRLNVWPVCQFTGNGQKELSVRWVCAGTTVKTAKRINAWVLLKHR